MKRVLITGASSGIGKQLAATYLAEGFQVIACSRNIDKLKQEFGVTTDNLIFCQLDLDDKKTMLANTAQLDELDIVILNAGTCEYINDPLTFDSELFERVINTNVIGTAYCLEALLPRIKKGGQLAIVSSSVTYLPLTRSEAYGASKAALDYLTRTLAIDLAPKGIDVSLIRPGFVETPLTQKNTFSMPGIISSEKASQLIMEGIAKRRQEINFPRLFIFTLKLFSLLPNNLWRRIAIKMIKQEK